MPRQPVHPQHQAQIHQKIQPHKGIQINDHASPPPPFPDPWDKVYRPQGQNAVVLSPAGQRKFPVLSPFPVITNCSLVNFLTFVVKFLLTNIVSSVTMEVPTTRR